MSHGGLRVGLTKMGWAMAFGAMVAAAALGQPAMAGPSDLGPAETAQTLADSLAAKLADLGAKASIDEEASALRTLIANSGASCAIAARAIRIVQSARATSGASAALDRLKATLKDSKDRECKSWFPPPGSASGALAGVGAPPAYVGGGGSNYIVH